ARGSEGRDGDPVGQAHGRGPRACAQGPAGVDRRARQSGAVRHPGQGVASVPGRRGRCRTCLVLALQVLLKRDKRDTVPITTILEEAPWSSFGAEGESARWAAPLRRISSRPGALPHLTRTIAQLTLTACYGVTRLRS